MSHKIALYIHIPFCRRRCRYCSFVSYQQREEAIPAYLGALEAEISRHAVKEPIASIYFGGGTPSLLSPGQLNGILGIIISRFSVDYNAEITLEANPGTIDLAYLKEIRNMGINRLSLGIQSLDDGELAMLGRIHTAAEAAEAMRLSRGAGFDNINMDIIYGLPGQTLESWRNTLNEAIGMQPEHLSLYGLTLEADTPLLLDIERDMLPALDPDLSATQYELAEDMLAEHSYRHYEISNWARPGRECSHNITYWENRPYLGFGAAAHSCWQGHRLANTADLDNYISDFSAGKSPRPEMDEIIGPELHLAESIILGLRLGEGIDIADFYNQKGIDFLSHYHHQIKEMTVAGLLERVNGNIRLTRRGRLLSNEVFWRFLPEETAVTKSLTKG